MRLSDVGLLMYYSKKRSESSGGSGYPIVDYGAGPIVYHPYNPSNVHSNEGSYGSFQPTFTTTSKQSMSWSNYPYVTDPSADGLFLNPELVEYVRLYWDIVYTSFPPFGDDFTICQWMSPNGRSMGNQVIFGQADPYTSTSDHFFKIKGYHDGVDPNPANQNYFQAEISMTFSDGTDLSVYALDTIPNTDLDIHWFVYRISKNNFMDIWIDGEQSGTVSLPTKEFNTGSTHNWSYLDNNDDSPIQNCINGEFRFYDRLMSQEEIWQLYFQYTGIDKRP
jgi:hypothetical protein